MVKKRLRVGIIGMGGFAAAHHDAVHQLEREGECQLVCTCDPQMDAFAERQEELRFSDRGARLFTDYQQMLDACRDSLDLVTVPAPIPLHAEMHRACVERGIPAYLEKPPTLDYAELERMLQVESRAARMTNVGFNYIVEPERQALKQRLVAGEFGALERVCVSGLWPRSDRYYSRARWAGRLMVDGRLVLDSCLGNAMAHLAHNGLFWCGKGEVWSWGDVERVAAELYRAHRIQGADTVFLRASIKHGPDLDIAMSHACGPPARSQEWVECERAVIAYIMDNGRPDDSVRYFVVRWKQKEKEVHQVKIGDYLVENLRAYLDYLRGLSQRPVTQLIDCRPFVHLNDLSYVAARRIATVREKDVERGEGCGDEGEYAAIRDLETIANRFLTGGQFPSEQGLCWAVPGGHACLGDLPRLVATIEEMAAEEGSAGSTE